MATVRITGIKQIDKALKQLTPTLQKKAIRQAMRQAMKPTLAAARINAPVETGATRKNIKIRASRSRKKGIIRLRIVVGKDDFQGKQFYAAFQEYGWKTGSRSGKKLQRRKGQEFKAPHSRVQIEGKHFMRRAFESTESQAKNNAERLILVKVAEIVAKLKAKG